MQPVRIGTFDYTKGEKGEWVFKAIESTPLAAPKEKPKYREVPQFPLQVTIESKSKNRFMKVMNLSVIEITKHIKEKLL